MVQVITGAYGSTFPDLPDLPDLPNRTVDVAAGSLFLIETGVSHALEAVEESVFLVTMAGTRAALAARAERTLLPAEAAPAAEEARGSRSGQRWEDDGGRD
jgi:hypothetical protein